MIEIETGNSVDVIDITDRVEQNLRESDVENGICLVYSLHTTTGLTVNEADTALINDILNLLKKIAPKGAGYKHDQGDGNAHAHLQATLLGNSVIIPVEMGRLVLGTWQRILFFELDGPRRRSIFVRIISNSQEKVDQNGTVA
jgi:secondary thiamine-phosphate synthase enzyme